MGYDRDRDNRFRGRGEDDNRWQGNRYEREGGTFGNWGSNRGRGDWEGRGRGPGGDDRGFVERAGDEVRSWFGGDEDRGGRERSGYGRDEYVRWQNASGGQFRGDPVHHREGGYRGGGEARGPVQWNDNRGHDRMRQTGGESGGGEGFAGGGGYGEAGGGVEVWGGSGFGGPDDHGRRFDRIDAGSTGTQGAHPMSSPVGGGYGGGIDSSGGFGGGSSAREAAIIRQAQRQGGDGGQQFGGSAHHADRHYTEWRNRQIEELDRDYHDYRQEHQSKFEQEFGGWRQKRQTQRQHFGRAREHMEVLGSDGAHIGTVDKIAGDKIILTKNDENAGGVHHSIPCSWIESVEDKVTVNKTAQEAMDAWTNEDSQRALFERSDAGSDGPHVLNRSFSGTYDEK
ncbi:MAG TPA: DUF2171 domain-containing protein [Allosphingosinicella sp.]|jgi:hypothetical protein